MGLDNPVHILLLAAVLLLVFGAKRLPEIGRSLGDGMRGFKDSLSGDAPDGSLLPSAPADPRLHVSRVAAPPPQAITASPAEPVASALGEHA